MHTVRGGIGYVCKEAIRQLALDVDVVLLHIPVLGIGVRSQRRRPVRRHESGQTGLRVASGRQNDSSIAEWSRLSASGRGGAARQDAVESVHRAEGSLEPISRSNERSAGEVHYIVIGVKPKRDVVRDVE